MRKCFFFLLINIFAFGQSGFAQSKDSTLAQTYRPNLAIKFSLLPLLDYTPALQFGLEIGTAKNQSLHVEYGYVKDYFRSRDFSGYKLKGEYRFYKAVSNEPNILKFRGIQYMYKQVINPASAFVWRNSQTYQEFVSYKILNRTNSIFAIGGFAFNTSKPVGFEASFGLGYRRFEVSLIDLPDDATVDWDINRNIFQPSRPGVFHMPGLFFNFRVLWRIW